MQITKPHKAKHVNGGRGAGRKGDLRLAMEGLEPGMAITIKDAAKSRQWFYSLSYIVSLEMGRDYKCNHMGDGVYQIARLS